ncbi:MAG: hypothetical protein ABIK31_07040 [candidate division WOR-3 bacterium]
MKIKFLLIIMLIIIVNSCQYEHLSEPKDKMKDIVRPLVPAAESIGLLHNSGCLFMKNNWDTSWDISSEQDFQVVWGMLCGYFKNYHYFDSVEIYDSLYDILYRISSAENFHNELLEVFNELKQHYVWTNLVSQQEKYFIDALFDIFNTNFSNMTHFQVSTFIINKTDSLKTIWSTIDWDDTGDTLLALNVITSIQNNGSGNLSFGAIDVLQKSAEFWRDNDPIPPFNPTLFSLLLKADAIGYIIGWGKAVKDDLDSGKLIPERQWIRIQKGIDGATFASLGWGLAKKFL